MSRKRQEQGTEQAGGQGSGEQSREKQAQPQQGMQRGGGGGMQGGGMARRGTFAPSLFSMNPFTMLRMSPFALMRQFTEEMDRMFEDAGTGGTQNQMTQGQAGGARSGGALFSPQVEVFEREGQLVVRADLPGLRQDDVRVEMTDDGLLIEGERRYEHTENQGGVYRSERSYGTFRRHVPLPEGVNAENATARFQNGVLEITMQAPQRQQTRRRIEIQGEGGTSGQETQQASAQQGQGQQAQAAGK